jgi:hypothetical protein
VASPNANRRRARSQTSTRSGSSITPSYRPTSCSVAVGDQIRIGGSSCPCPCRVPAVILGAHEHAQERSSESASIGAQPTSEARQRAPHEALRLPRATGQRSETARCPPGCASQGTRHPCHADKLRVERCDRCTAFSSPLVIEVSCKLLRLFERHQNRTLEVRGSIPLISTG